MSAGYIKLYRKVTESIVWTNSDMLKLWVLCLTKAAHTERNFLFNGNELKLDPGEFVTGRDSLAEEFNKGAKPKDKVASRTLWRHLKRMEKHEMLSIRSNNRYSVISICNWSEYQKAVQQVSSDCPATVQQVSTNKNDKNEKNEKNDNKNNPRKKRTYEETSIEYELASLLYHRILENNEEFKKPNLQTWSNHIRLMIEQDNRNPEKIRGMINWCQNDDFWYKVILSTRSLRNKYDQMNVQAAGKRNKPNVSNVKPNTDWKESRYQ